MNTRNRHEERQRVCGRCGIRHIPNERTPGKQFCLDCRPDAAAFGWYYQPSYGELTKETK